MLCGRVTVGGSSLNEPRSSAAPSSQVVRELRSWCEESGASQSSLAMEIGVSVSHLNQVINGRARPSARLIRRIAEVLEHRKTRKVNAIRRMS